MYTKHQGWRISNKDPSTKSAFRASSDDVDGFLTLRVDPLEERRSTWRMWHNRLTQDGQRYNKPLNLVLRGTPISYSAAIDLVAELGVSQVDASGKDGGIARG
ncbi:hypothetical protein M9H77_21985 [Catharanthus roseus]|uniref:Uncharacterized protein n=1 Tax=Catharanthus roseus TaxID=4058 RepID=A0ACC0AQD9_CATRO|nr:hypothetical protein M9H77_21985 [Catharanthus roseus]